MSVFTALARDWLPPAVLRWLHQKRSGATRFEGEFVSWGDASARCTGYDAEEILAKVLTATLAVKSGNAVFERDSVLFNEVEYAWPVLCGLMWAAARNGGKLNVLDFGGALGSSYFQNRRFLQSLRGVEWCVVEQPHYVEAGRKYIQDEQLRFYKTIAECVAENHPNVILLSGVLQYLESPDEVIGELSKLGASCLIIERTPFSSREVDTLVTQKVPASIYKASYPMWIFSQSRLEKKLGESWDMVATNLSPEGYVRTSTGVDFSFKGMLLGARQ